MFIVQPQITYNQKKDKVFSLLWELKKYDFKVKAYYLWLSAKEVITELELDKVYESIVDSVTQVKQDELNKRMDIFKMNNMKLNEIRIMESKNIQENDIEFI
ncbi:MAG: hypothetical protein ACD_3C00110G0003 [uncultured bacterium (gcode 4)]|uniref:Uncharacterized protein n=1 Tax=uncultured bacterium (gcode 4) TaxID=1234023 RepID=K2GXB8_9BACT|nr:MAG: hypothetical protein ACD_3C00110G0003 [uncultured bacterium (gcode 4)]